MIVECIARNRSVTTCSAEIKHGTSRKVINDTKIGSSHHTAYDYACHLVVVGTSAHYIVNSVHNASWCEIVDYQFTSFCIPIIGSRVTWVCRTEFELGSKSNVVFSHGECVRILDRYFLFSLIPA